LTILADVASGGLGNADLDLGYRSRTHVDYGCWLVYTLSMASITASLSGMVGLAVCYFTAGSISGAGSVLLLFPLKRVPG